MAKMGVMVSMNWYVDYEEVLELYVYVYVYEIFDFPEMVVESEAHLKLQKLHDNKEVLFTNPAWKNGGAKINI